MAVNSWNEPQKVLSKFVEDGKLKQRVLLKGALVARRDYRVRDVPISFWISPDGRIADRLGGSSSFDRLDEKTRSFLERYR